jgi:hypothetical protein
MITLKQLRSIQCIEDFEALSLSPCVYDISHRGGKLGFSSTVISSLFKINEAALSKNVGVYCNYLGGGVRGTINASSYSTLSITGRKKALLDAFLAACRRVYENVENSMYLNDTEYPDGDTNYDALVTNLSRKAGIVSSY